MGVHQVLLPERVGRRGLMGRHRELRVLDGLDRQQHLAEQSAGRFAGAHRHLEGGQRQERREEPDADRVPAQGVQAEPPALRPAAQEEQRVGRVGPQEVAVDGGLAGPLGLGDPLVGDRDRLVAPAEQIQDRGQVGVHAEQIVEMAELRGLVARLAQHPDGRLGVFAPGVGDGQGARRVQQLLAGVVADGRGHVDGVLGVALAPRRRRPRASGTGPARRERGLGACVGSGGTSSTARR